VTELQFVKKTLIFAPLERVFAFCSSRSGFEKHFPYKVDWQNGPERWHQGDVLNFRFLFLKKWINYQAVITSFSENEHFIDEMKQGPYKMFVHKHSFERMLKGTLYTDTIDFTLGYGNFLDRTIGLRLLETTFTRRHAKMKEYLETISQIPNCEEYCS
jgi:ligand-binding SRPBCC domain-containing protein